MTQRPSPRRRRSGPGVGVQVAPLFVVAHEERLAVGSLTGSPACGVSRFSRLLPDQVKAAPPAVTMVPNSGLAITLAHGNGVSWSPSRWMTYSRPSVVKPPSRLSSFELGQGGRSDRRPRRLDWVAVPRARAPRGRQLGSLRVEAVELLRELAAIPAQHRAGALASSTRSASDSRSPRSR